MHTERRRLMSLTAKVAYLKGLAEGSGLTSNEREGKFYKELLDCLEDISVTIDFLDQDHDEIEDYLEALDEDLTELEEYVYDDDDDEYEIADEDFDVAEAICPECGETVSYFDDLYDEDVDIICPYCDAVVATLEGVNPSEEAETEEE